MIKKMVFYILHFIQIKKLTLISNIGFVMKEFWNISRKWMQKFKYNNKFKKNQRFINNYWKIMSLEMIKS